MTVAGKIGAVGDDSSLDETMQGWVGSVKKQKESSAARPGFPQLVAPPTDVDEEQSNVPGQLG